MSNSPRRWFCVCFLWFLVIGWAGFPVLADEPTPAELNVQGQNYLLGSGGVEKDYTKARALLERAAAGGDSDAMAELGSMYRDGLGTPKDYNAAIGWYRKSADAGNDAAMTNLGSFYAQGAASLRIIPRR